MAADRYNCIFISRTRIRVVAVHGQIVAPGLEVYSEGEPSELGRAIQSALMSAGLIDLPTFVLLDSTCVLFSVVENTTARVSDREALSYAAESVFPLVAENMIVCGHAHGRGRIAIVVAEREWLDPLTTELIRAGVDIRRIVPESLCALQSLLNERAIPNTGLVWLTTSERTEAFALSSAKVERWVVAFDRQGVSNESPEFASSEPSDGDVVFNWFEADNVNGSQRRNSVVFDGAELPAQADGSARIVRSEGFEEFCSQAARRYLSKKPWFDLLRPAIPGRANVEATSKDWYATGVIALFALLLFSVSCWLRINRLEQTGIRLDQARTELARDVMPELTSTRGLVQILETERSRLAAIEQELATLQPPRTLETFLLVLAALPESLSVAYDEITFDDASVVVSGLADSADEPRRITAALQSAGFRIEKQQMGTEFQVEATIDGNSARTFTEAR